MLRAFVAVVGTALCVGELAQGFWFWAALVLVAIASVFPATPAAWVLMVALGSSLLTRTPSALDGRIYALIAGIHLLHLLAAYARVVPGESWVQLRAFAAPLRRYVLVQVPVQLIAALALFAFAPRSGAQPVVLPIIGVVAALALVVLAIVLVVPFFRQKG